MTKKSEHMPCPRCGRPIVPWASYEHPGSSYQILGGARVCESCAAKACIRYVLNPRTGKKTEL
jgi:hypothetical protein